MSSTNTASTRKCPVCDAPNSNLSIFCAECGASINAPDSDDTAAYRPVSNDDVDAAQQTDAYEPASYAADSAHSTRVAAESPPDEYGSTWHAPNAPASPSLPTPVRSPADVTFQAEQASSEPQGIRGFVLGVLAVLLILTVFLLWTWATLLDQGTRDSIQNFFGFTG